MASEVISKKNGDSESVSYRQKTISKISTASDNLTNSDGRSTVRRCQRLS
jgi:hypothetical protein